MPPVFRESDGPGPRRDVVGYGRHVPKVTWPEGARVAVSIVLNWEEGSEYSKIAGDGRNEGLAEIPYVMEPEYRDLAAESVYEYGGRAGVWRLQRLFDEFRVPVTFFGAAMAFERNPEVAAYLREAGHEPCCHGWRWEEVWTLSRDEEREHMLEAIRSIERTCGTRPLGWYCRYGPSVNTRELLVEEGGFVYDSDAYNDDLPYYTEVGGRRHLIVPYSFTYNDGRYVLPQGFSDPSSFFDQCRRGLDYLWDEGATHPRMMSIGLHSRWAGQAGRTSGLRDFIEYAKEKGDDDPWDMKLVRGGLTDLDFIAQGLVLAHAQKHTELAGLSTEATFAEAQAAGLLSADDARTLIDAHKLFNDIFQWQRLTIEGKFDAEKVPPVILKRLATVAGLPSAQVLLEHLGEMYRKVSAIFGATGS